MICYKDMTFCEFKDCKHFNNGCPRSLTFPIKRDAIINNLPICQFIDKPDCYKENAAGQMPDINGQMATDQ